MSVPRPRPPLALLGGLTLLAGYLALVYELALVMLLFGFLLSLFVIALAVALIGVPSLAARRELPAEVMAGAPFDVTLTVVNTSAVRTALFVNTEDALQSAASEPPAGLVVSLGPAEQASYSYRTSIAIRGEHRHAAVRFATRFPFGLFERRWIGNANSTIVVLPKPGRLRRDVLVETPVAQAEVPVAVRGGLGEFHGVREFHSDDNPRWIHWRTSARRGELHVREFEREIERRVAVVLDASGSEGETFERAVTLAATLADHYARRGYRVALAVSGGRPAWVPFGSGAEHVRAALRPLALARPGRGTPPWPGSELRGAQTICVLTGSADADLHSRLAAVSASLVTVTPSPDLLDEAAHE